MRKFFMKNPFKRMDLRLGSRLGLQWSPATGEDSLRKILEYSLGLAETSIDWYIHAKNKKRRYARSFRAFAILLGGTAALLPAVAELYEKNGVPGIPVGWTTILLGLVGILLLLDRFFGFSTGWMRYLATELHLQQIAREFQLDWEAERASWQGAQPTKEQVLQMLARSKAFVSQLDTIVRDETNAWIQEFESALQQIDEAAKARTAITEPGALNLTVTNGAGTDNGWTLSIDGGTPEHYTGETAGRRNVIPGRHAIRVEGTVGGKSAQAERVVTVPVGGTCDETVTLI